MRRTRQIAINRAEIAKRFKRLKEFLEGFNAFKQLINIDANPYDPNIESKKYVDWMNGWYMAQLRAEEKVDER